jgi:hypothetical protein
MVVIIDELQECEEMDISVKQKYENYFYFILNKYKNILIIGD